MKLFSGVWIQLVDRFRSRVLFQCATDELSAEEFDLLWAKVGENIRRRMMEEKDGATVEFEIRASRTVAT